MRISLLTIGSRGDTQPYLALALALKARGHQPRLCAPSNFAALARGLEVDFVPVPWDTRQALEEDGLRRLLLHGDVVGFFRRINRRAWDLREGLWRAWETACDGAQALIPGTTIEDAVLLLGRARGIPVLLNELMPFAPRPDFGPVALGRRNLGPLNTPLHWAGRQVWWRINRHGAAALADRLGLARPWGPPSLAALRQGAPLLGAYSPSLLPPPTGWDPARRPVTGAWRLPRAAAQALPGDHLDAGFAAWLEDGPPPLFLGFGSMPAAGGQDLVELAGDLAEALDLRVVLGAGWSDVDAANCDLPENVAIAGDCDYGWLFEHCCGVVHHGGAGTSHTAAASGLPQVVCPFFADQPFWAQTLAKAGVATALPFDRVEAGALAEAVAQSLEHCADPAAALAAQIASEPGAAAAAEHVERWLGA
ncbi:MAG TPA: glycosyltransferase [bacterium]|jgi:sterol 3beta-glucosyltransferase|nr:glycosyltransferase [bacterium]